MFPKQEQEEHQRPATRTAVDNKKTVEKKEEAQVEASSLKVTATNIYGGMVSVKDAPSGKKYLFPLGVPVSLDPLDVEFIRGKMRTNGGCCGRPLTQAPMFEINE